MVCELQKRNHVIGIFIDLSKAFNTISHDKLVVKLEHYAIRGTCIELLKSQHKTRGRGGWSFCQAEITYSMVLTVDDFFLKSLSLCHKSAAFMRLNAALIGKFV